MILKFGGQECHNKIIYKAKTSYNKLPRNLTLSSNYNLLKNGGKNIQMARQ